MRVRFAPSPTGYLHVGGARTAIFNWLLARRHAGRFILRIEDTDRERSTAESEAALIDDLRWLGLDWDEGPDVGGDFGPYRQSERLDLYRARADELVDSGHAYYAQEPDSDFTGKKDYSRTQDEEPATPPVPIAAADGRARMGRDESVVIRFRRPEETVTFTDLVRGEIHLDTATISDFVLLRSNGFPTYNFAATVDDHEMRITDVVRGEDHLYNTLRQILIYEALGAPPPRFAHVPLILAEDRSKLSKRHGASSVGELRRAGFLPDAVVNYLVLLGWSHPDGRELLDLEEMQRVFSIDRVGKAGAVYDGTKLRWLNGQHLRAMPSGDFFALADPRLPEDIRSAYSDDARHRMLVLLQEGLESLDELDAAAAVFREAPAMEAEATQALADEEAGRVLDAVAERLKAGTDELTAETFKALMKEAGKAAGAKGKALFFPVRAALTGAVHGPDLAGVAAIKGRERVIGLLERAREMTS